MATFEQMGVNGLFENLLRQIEAPMNMDVKVTQQTSPENMKGMKEAPNIAQVHLVISTYLYVQ